MADTIELIKRHTQELDEYMKKNGKYSFHRFSDGSIHYNASVFNDKSRIEDEYLIPIEPVEELEELEKITKINDTLVTINDFVTFEGWDAILGETGIGFYGLSVEIEYTGIYSLNVDCYHDLKILIMKIKRGYFGKIVLINEVRINVQDLKAEKNGIKCVSTNMHIKYYYIYLITDIKGKVIYRG